MASHPHTHRQRSFTAAHTFDDTGPSVSSLVRPGCTRRSVDRPRIPSADPNKSVSSPFYRTGKNKIVVELFPLGRPLIGSMNGRRRDHPAHTLISLSHTTHALVSHHRQYEKQFISMFARRVYFPIDFLSWLTFINAKIINYLSAPCIANCKMFTKCKFDRTLDDQGWLGARTAGVAAPNDRRCSSAAPPVTRVFNSNHSNYELLSLIRNQNRRNTHLVRSHHLCELK